MGYEHKTVLFDHLIDITAMNRPTRTGHTHFDNSFLKGIRKNFKTIHNTDTGFEILVLNFEKDIFHSFEIITFLGKMNFAFFHVFLRIT